MTHPSTHPSNIPPQASLEHDPAFRALTKLLTGKTREEALMILAQLRLQRGQLQPQYPSHSPYPPYAGPVIVQNFYGAQPSGAGAPPPLTDSSPRNGQEPSRGADPDPSARPPESTERTRLLAELEALLRALTHDPLKWIETSHFHGFIQQIDEPGHRPSLLHEASRLARLSPPHEPDFLRKIQQPKKFLELLPEFSDQELAFLVQLLTVVQRDMVMCRYDLRDLAVDQERLLADPALYQITPKSKLVEDIEDIADRIVRKLRLAELKDLPNIGRNSRGMTHHLRLQWVLGPEHRDTFLDVGAANLLVLWKALQTPGIFRQTDRQGLLFVGGVKFPYYHREKPGIADRKHDAENLTK